MNRTLFQVFKRSMHDRKLPSVILSKQTPANLIGTQSPKKLDHNLNQFDCENESWVSNNNKNDIIVTTYSKTKIKSILYKDFNKLNKIIKPENK